MLSNPIFAPLKSLYIPERLSAAASAGVSLSSVFVFARPFFSSRSFEILASALAFLERLLDAASDSEYVTAQIHLPSPDRNTNAERLKRSRQPSGVAHV